MNEYATHQAGEKQWQRLIDKVTWKCGGRVPAWDDPELNFLSERERILYFSNLVRIWLVQPIEKMRELNRQDPDYGFALLLVVNPIPELLGKLILGKEDSDAEGNEGDVRKYPYNEGVRYALPYCLDDHELRSVYIAIRCALAHSAVIEGNASQAVASLSNDYELPIEVKRQRNCKGSRCVVYVSPDKFAQAVLNAMNRYVYELRFELNGGGSDKLSSFRDYLENT